MNFPQSNIVFFFFFFCSFKAEGDRLPPGHTVRQLETCKIRSIRAGTLERLVETLLTAFGDNDLTYTSIFLSTYRAFTSTQTVLQLLLDRYIRVKCLKVEISQMWHHWKQNFFFCHSYGCMEDGNGSDKSPGSETSGAIRKWDWILTDTAEVFLNQCLFLCEMIWYTSNIYL